MRLHFAANRNNRAAQVIYFRMSEKGSPESVRYFKSAETCPASLFDRSEATERSV
jgi:hypothetical protein